MRWSMLVAAAGCLLWPATTLADSLSASRSQPLRETEHLVALRMRDGIANYVVQRSFHNGGERHEEARLGIEMPVGAAGVGLRIRAGGSWFDGELMRRERAAALYQELTGIGPHAPKDPALLSWQWSDRLQLNLFPIVPGGTSTVEYTLVAPTRYRAGRYFVSYPMVEKTAALTAPVLNVIGAHELMVDGRSHSGGAVTLRPRKLPGWLTEHAPNAGSQYVWSHLQVTDPVSAAALTVSFDVRHTYRNDLLIELRSPAGTWHTLHDRTGGSDNDVRVTKKLSLGAATALAGRWTLVLSDHANLDVGSLEGWSLSYQVGSQRRRQQAQDTPLFLPDAPSGATSGHANISFAAGAIRTVAARLGRVPVAERKAFSRLEIDVAQPLRPTPKRLAVAFVVDGSHSIEQPGVDAQIAMVKSFLRHVPDARFNVFAYRRYARAVFDDWVPAADAHAQLALAKEAGKLGVDNGSALDQGLRLAAQRLRGQPAPRTIVIFSDDLLRPSWNNQAAFDEMKALPEGTTVHLVVKGLDRGLVQDTRLDTHPLAPIAARAGGVLLRVDGLRADAGKQLDAISLGLVRPIRIDDFEVHGLKLDADQQPPKRLDEGEGIREMALGTAAPVEVTLTGKIWARAFRRKVRATIPFSRATAAFAFSHDMHGDLSEQEQFSVAMLGRAVSPVTSYIAIEPGVRPSKVGLESIGFGAGGMGLRGFGAGGGGSGRATITPDLKPRLEELVKACKQEHAPPASWSMRLSLRLTFHEIVDISAAGPANATSQCVVDAAWGLQLERAFNRRRMSVSFSFR